MLLGEYFLTGAAQLVWWFVLPLSEEKDLEEKFLDEYRTYKKNVPRWIPRLTKWVQK